MADKVAPNDKEVDIRFSRIMRLSTAIALGSLATVGLGVYLLVDPILRNLGQQTPTQEPTEEPPERPTPIEEPTEEPTPEPTEG